MNTDMMIVVGSFAIGSGLILSVIYYFARYYIKTDHEEDTVVDAKPSVGEVTRDLAPAADVPAPRFEEKAVAVPPPQEPATLKAAMTKTRESFWGRLRGALMGSQPPSEHVEAIEEILYTSDLGPRTVQRLMDSIHESGKNLSGLDDLKSAFKMEFVNILSPVAAMGESPLDKVSHQPEVWMVVGVNGVGKTTTIGKLAYAAAQKNLKVLVAAGDTFRAAAQEQLKVWTERAQVEIFAPPGVTEPAAVAFEAYQLARTRGFDLVIIDTAGRLHTQKNLMEELKKVKRVLQKINPEVPHESLIVLDANSGQNALIQAKEFNDALQLTGAVVTKMDGTAKGGVVLGLAEELKIPTRLIGVGEGVLDLKTFSVSEYVDSILG